MPKGAKEGHVLVSVSVDQAEASGLHLYDYTLKYMINGSKFRRSFRNGKEARNYATILQENGIESSLTYKRRKGARNG